MVANKLKTGVTRKGRGSPPDEVDRLVLKFVLVVAYKSIAFTKYCRSNMGWLGNPDAPKHTSDHAKYVQSKNRKSFLLRRDRTELKRFTRSQLQKNPIFFDDVEVELSDDEEEDAGDENIPPPPPKQSLDLIPNKVPIKPLIKAQDKLPPPQLQSTDVPPCHPGPASTTMSKKTKNFRFMDPVSWDGDIPAYELNFDKPWNNMFEWFPQITPQEDQGSDHEWQTYFTLSKPRADPRNPIPILRPKRMNEHTIRVTELVS
jgi:hypothetical protein